MRRRLVVALLLTALVPAGIAGCGEQSAADRVCEERTDLADSIDDVRTEVADADFGEARPSPAW